MADQHNRRAPGSGPVARAFITKVRGMAVRIICDGCDVELTLADSKVRCRVSFTDDFFNPGEFDLCHECAQIAHESFTTKTWPRKVGPRRPNWD